MQGRYKNMSNNQEHIKTKQEQGIESQIYAAEQLERISKSPENTAELSPRDIEARTDKARTEALRNAAETNIKTEKENHQIKTNRHGSISKKQRNESYNKILKQTQRELSVSSRIFSRITHIKAIETTSDFIGNTVARPDAMLAGAFFAFIATLFVYVIAKTLGYALSGFETIAAFIIGWLAGIIYDYLKILITGKKS